MKILNWNYNSNKIWCRFFFISWYFSYYGCLHIILDRFYECLYFYKKIYRNWFPKFPGWPFWLSWLARSGNWCCFVMPLEQNLENYYCECRLMFSIIHNWVCLCAQWVCLCAQDVCLQSYLYEFLDGHSFGTLLWLSGSAKVWALLLLLSYGEDAGCNLVALLTITVSSFQTHILVFTG